MDVTIVPEEGNFPAVARALLDVADHPSQVRMVTYPVAGFLVPEEIFQRSEGVDGQDAPESGVTEDAAPKRRGRPRRAPIDTEPVEGE